MAAASPDFISKAPWPYNLFPSTLYSWQIPSKLKKPIYSLLKKEPGNEEVNLPCSTTNLPFTITSLIPDEKR